MTHEYTIQLRRTLKGPNGSTQYKFPVKTLALCFAAGYQEGLLALGRDDLYVRVVDDRQRVVADHNELRKVGRR